MATFIRIIKVQLQMIFKHGDAANLDGHSAKDGQKRPKLMENIWLKFSTIIIINPNHLKRNKNCGNRRQQSTSTANIIEFKTIY